jgi:hypothetical protein
VEWKGFRGVAVREVSRGGGMAEGLHRDDRASRRMGAGERLEIGSTCRSNGFRGYYGQPPFLPEGEGCRTRARLK